MHLRSFLPIVAPADYELLRSFKEVFAPLPLRRDLLIGRTAGKPSISPSNLASHRDITVIF